MRCATRAVSASPLFAPTPDHVRHSVPDLPPLRSAGGTVTLPGSKSISNRVLLLAALSAGETTVHDLLDSDDTRVMLTGLEQLGCGIERLGEHTIQVRGLGGALPVRSAELFLGNAGTAMRPLTAALALLATQLGGQFELSGIARMHERPIGGLGGRAAPARLPGGLPGQRWLPTLARGPRPACCAGAGYPHPRAR